MIRSVFKITLLYLVLYKFEKKYKTSLKIDGEYQIYSQEIVKSYIIDKYFPEPKFKIVTTKANVLRLL